MSDQKSRSQPSTFTQNSVTQSTVKQSNSKAVKNIFGISSLLFIILLANGTYLGVTDLYEWFFRSNIQNSNYQYMFALHLGLGVLLIFFFPLYIVGHLKCITQQLNTAASEKGKFLAFVLLSIIITGLLLVRGISSLEINNNLLRDTIYYLHILLPLTVVFLYLKHRQLGNNKIYYSNKIPSFLILLFFFIPLTIQFSTENIVIEKKTFSPSLLKTSDKNWRLDDLVQDEYCAECHSVSHHRWNQSAHRFSSFNNPFYRFAVNNFRKKLRKKTGNVSTSRFCAGCHDPVPLLTGEFDQLDFSLTNNASASVGINCTVCHAVNKIDSVKGNADFTLAKPSHYPFAKSESSMLRWFSNVLIKSNPDFHKRSFLKPLHKKNEFCGSCHKVSIPPEVNNYRWLRGQNHYDSFFLSGASGHSVTSFYYPKKAITHCNQCHMPLIESDEFGAFESSSSDTRKVHDHLFPAANTAMLVLQKKPSSAALLSHEKILKKSARINIIGFRKDGKINGEFIGPINEKNISLKAGETYLIEVVVRTTDIGHTFTQGTADSNQVWISLDISTDGTTLARSGSLDQATGKLSNNSHLINAYLVDKNGKKIDRRNVENFHTTLYNHQIPPGSADVIHYRFTMPNNTKQLIKIKTKLNYRKFNTDYYRLSLSNTRIKNSLPVTVIHSDEIVLSLNNNSELIETKPDWMALNDYGIGLFRKSAQAQFRQAEQIFRQIMILGHQEGGLNLARLYFQQGRLKDASTELEKLDKTKLDNPWTATWFSALINRDNGFLDKAITLFEKLIQTDWPDAKSRGFDFSKNYQLLNVYAATVIMRSKQEQAETETWYRYISKATQLYQDALRLDPENSTTHFGLYKSYAMQGKTAQAAHHNQQHRYYKKDDTAQGEAIRLARRKSTYANKMANPVVIYELTQAN